MARPSWQQESDWSSLWEEAPSAPAPHAANPVQMRPPGGMQDPAALREAARARVRALLISMPAEEAEEASGSPQESKGFGKAAPRVVAGKSSPWGKGAGQRVPLVPRPLRPFTAFGARPFLIQRLVPRVAPSAKGTSVGAGRPPARTMGVLARPPPGSFRPAPTSAWQSQGDESGEPTEEAGWNNANEDDESWGEWGGNESGETMEQGGADVSAGEDDTWGPWGSGNGQPDEEGDGEESGRQDGFQETEWRRQNMHVVRKRPYEEVSTLAGQSFPGHRSTCAQPAMPRPKAAKFLEPQILRPSAKSAPSNPVLVANAFAQAKAKAGGLLKARLALGSKAFRGAGETADENDNWTSRQVRPPLPSTAFHDGRETVDENDAWAWQQEDLAAHASPPPADISRTVVVPEDIAETVIADLSSTEFKVSFRIDETQRVYDGTVQVHFGPGPQEFVEEAAVMLGEHIEDLMSQLTEEQHMLELKTLRDSLNMLASEEANPKIESTAEEGQKGAAEEPQDEKREAKKEVEPVATKDDPAAAVDKPQNAKLEAKKDAKREARPEVRKEPQDAKADARPEVKKEEQDAEPEAATDKQLSRLGLNSPSPSPQRGALNSPSDEEIEEAADEEVLTPVEEPEPADDMLNASKEAAVKAEEPLQETTHAAPLAVKQDKQIVQEPVPEASTQRAMTIEDWLQCQDQFNHLPRLPANWIRVKSSGGGIYYFNTATGHTQCEDPLQILPPGWQRVVSRSSGQEYYWNAQLGKSQFEYPTA